MKSVKIYVTEWCPFCVRAKRLLEKKSIPYETVDVDNDPATRAWLVQQTGRRTVPQIFIGDESIGGFTELQALDARGELDSKIS